MVEDNVEAKDEKSKLDLKGKNIYQKMIIARSMFLATPKKKSGRMEITKTRTLEYYQLDDIVPIISKIETTCQILCHTTFCDKGVLTIFNAESPEQKIDYTTPISLDALGRGTGIQNIGAMETYCRRYLYLLAFDIVEPESVDSLIVENNKRPQGNKPSPQQNVFITKEESENIYKTLRSQGVRKEIITQTLELTGKVSMGEIREKEINAFMATCRRNNEEVI